MKDDGTWDTPTDTTYSGGDGIDITSGIITVDLASSNSGLVIDSHKLAVNANSAKGIEVGASGVGVRLATNSGLEFSSGLKVKTDGTTIHTNASGELEVIGGGGSGEMRVCSPSAGFYYKGRYYTERHSDWYDRRVERLDYSR